MKNGVTDKKRLSPARAFDDNDEVSVSLIITLPEVGLLTNHKWKEIRLYFPLY
ncbi:MAG: hypothetical protein C00003105_02111 [ANME-2 cluster archaeon HR1]|nr:MAG: hypothetical protein C00003105_02111 [ANME-2 cluster archaeon HR1]